MVPRHAEEDVRAPQPSRALRGRHGNGAVIGSVESTFPVRANFVECLHQLPFRGVMRGYLAAGLPRSARPRPLALRPHLAMGLPFSGRRLWQRVSSPGATLAIRTNRAIWVSRT